MAFSITDVRYTTRSVRERANHDGGPEDAGVPGGVSATALAPGTPSLRLLYPRLLRDVTALPKLGIAIGYFESMVGKERRELDTEILVQFFGDPKLARCIVSSMARWYRFRTPLLAEVVTPRALTRLRRAGLDDPRFLRLDLYDRANLNEGGFLSFTGRAEMHVAVEQSFGLRAGELDRLLILDMPEHAVLTRTGEAPSPAEVVEAYNFDVLDTLLRRAEQVDVAMESLSDEGMGEVSALCESLGVHGEVLRRGRATLIRLRGRQDSLGTWSRHGRRVAAAVTALTKRYGDQILDTGALVALRDKRCCLKLTAELRRMLSAAPAPQALQAAQALRQTGVAGTRRARAGSSARAGAHGQVGRAEPAGAAATDAAVGDVTPLREAALTRR